MTAAPVPIRILITVALLAVFAAYGVWTGISQHSWQFGIVAALAIVACVGAARLRPWSQFLVYLLAGGFIAMWVYSIYAANKVGYFYGFSPLKITTSLAPGVLLVLLSVFCSYAVFKQFRGARFPRSGGELQ